jgi:predicted CoA-substrate-specific enzyme activase
MPPTPAAADERRTNDQAAPAQDRDETRVYLGVDVGSISTNLVLLSADDEEPTEKPCYEVLAGVYLPTRGRPVDALDEGLRELAAQSERDQTRWQVVGVGTTGSGRHLAARALGGDIVRNEITAQMVSATHVVPDVDTIFEIGGQDSKYISVRDGALSDFEMNKICAAGTGSFLEEQAERLGVSIFGEFAEQARQAKTPRDLGTRCTVFMDSELVRQQENGAPVSDLCAGLAYSVARNYLEKVVASRPVGKSVVFQGGTASNAAVVAAFRALLDRPVHVHPQNRISGAIGAGLLAARARREHHYQTQFRGFDACGSAEVKSFECKRCDNRCQVNRVSFGERAVHFGDACERFSERDQQVDNSPRPFAELFAQRQQLWREAVDASRPLGGESDRPPLGLLSGSVNLEQQPFWAAFVRQLGYRPVFAPPTSARLLKEYDSIVPPEICLPIKAAAAQFRALLDKGRSGQDGVEQVFIPSVMEHRKHKEDSEAHACLYHQQLPDMLRARHGEQLITAQFSLAEGMLGLASPTVALATALGRKKSEVLEALVVAKRAQKRFDAARHALGQKALRSDFERAVVVLGKPYNTHDPVLNLDVAASARSRRLARHSLGSFAACRRGARRALEDRTLAL